MSKWLDPFSFQALKLPKFLNCISETLGSSELDLREITHHNPCVEDNVYSTVVYLMTKNGKLMGSSSKGDGASGISLQLTIKFEAPSCSSAKFALSAGTYERSDGSGLLSYFKHPVHSCQDQATVDMDTASNV